MQLVLKRKNDNQVIKLTPGFFQPEVIKKGKKKIVITVEEKAQQIASDLKAKHYELFRNETLVLSSTKKPKNHVQFNRKKA